MSDAIKNINKAKWDDENKIYVYETDNSCIYIEEKTSIKEKIKVIQEYDLAGAAIWRLGFETADVWEAFEY
jgi:spore germination protein YaaH